MTRLEKLLLKHWGSDMDRNDMIEKLKKEHYVIVNNRTAKEEQLIIEDLEREELVTCTKSRFSYDHTGCIAYATNKLKAL